MAPLETISLSVPPEWHQAARYVGHKHVRTWIECVVEDFLESGPGRYFPLLPLDWHRGRFEAFRTEDGNDFAPQEVPGLIACCFGIYKGTRFVRTYPPSKIDFTLAHLPSGGRQIAILNRVKSCKALAEALAPLRIAWHQTVPDKVVGEDSERVIALVREYEQADLPERLRDGAEWRHAGVGGRA